MQEGFYLGTKTNNQAEYIALLLALFFLERFSEPNDVVRIASDSQLLVRQLKKEYRVKNNGLQELYMVARHWFDKRNPEIMHVMRTDNTHADRLANKGLDEKKQLPEAFITHMASYGISL